MIHGDLRRLQISLPPQHGKSELASRLIPAFLFGLNPDVSLIATSYSATLAEKMNRDVQRIIDSNEYKALFPGTRLNESNVRTASGNYLRNSDTFEVVDHKGVYLCAGVGGGITGQGGQWLIIDDPFKNREEADSPTFREKVWNWYTSTLYSRQRKDVRIIVINTRWHCDDLSGRLLKQSQDDPKADQWKVIELKAIAEHDRPAYDPRQEGEALWPAFKNLQELESMRATMGEYDWSALYQQNPRQGGGVEWPEKYFGPQIWFDEWPGHLDIRTTGVDPSKGRDGKHGDYGPIVNLGRARDGLIYIECDMERRSAESLVETTVENQKNFKADAIGFETNQFQELLAIQVRNKGRAENLAIPIVQLVNTVSKDIRIRRLGPYLEQGQFRFKAKSKGTKLLVEQLRDFPTAQHDDGPDALEMGLRVMIDLWNGRNANRNNLKGVRAR